MPSKNFSSHQVGSLVSTLVIKGVTSAEPAKILFVPKGALVKVYPTAAGSASVYHSNSLKQDIDLDNSNADIQGSLNDAVWDIWGAGTVTAKTSQQVNIPLMALAMTVLSGTWTIEVTIDNG